ncbi:MAG: cobalt-precorrin-5B (C(1))-methyltransferase CbiD [Spirochaetaceae bacterium]|jgi:cobalt-precorrin-5B (C1)-methyltransferase|nr:cobalt-precorrin-5B (C(1))-methyltransferase CbiD [Spirochaetaceae bacterium]
MDEYRILEGKKLRYGYTTGTCAAAAARAAAALILAEDPEEARSLEILTPRGSRVILIPEDIRREGSRASCGVRKDAGDDPDITNGIVIRAEVTKNRASRIIIRGGPGVGRVTKPGLDPPVGAPAINRTPLRMIRENLQAVCEKYGYRGGLTVTISIPGGEALAQKTFNPRLGILGGLSILGTSGVVEPKSNDGFTGAIRAEFSVLRAGGDRKALITPGNYGKDFLKAWGGAAGRVPVVCSNYIGEALDMAVEFGFEQLLLVGHIGKLIKLVTGNFNTHSRYGDPRLEIFAAYAGLAGAPRRLIGQILDCAVTEQALVLLGGGKLWEDVKGRILAGIQEQLDRRCGGKIKTGAVLFSTTRGLLGSTPGAADILKQWEGR